MPDYIPKSDKVYQDWLANFATVCGANLASLGLVSTDLDPLTKEKSFFDTAITNEETLSASAKAATEKKNMLRKSTEAKARALVKRIQAKADVTNDLKKQLQITVPGVAPAPPLIPYAPTGLVASVKGSGIYELYWNRNGNSAGVLFAIEGLFGSETEYKLIDIISKTTYIHKGNLPGQKIVYRVKAKRGEVYSDPSNDAIVNG